MWFQTGHYLRNPLTGFLGLSVALHIFIGLLIDSSDHQVKLEDISQGGIQISIQTAPQPTTKQNSSTQNTIAPEYTQPIIRKAQSTPKNEPQQEQSRQASAPPPSPAPKPEPSQGQLRSQIKTHLAKYFFYPRVAKMRGWEGEVILEIMILSNGDIKHSRIARSSGYDLLDRSALSAINKVKRIDNASHWLHGQDIEMKVSVFYQLQKG